MRPDRLLKWLRLDACPRAFRLAGRRERIGSGAPVVAPAGAPTVSGIVAAVDAEAAPAAFEQAPQHVVVLLVAPEREQRVARQPRGDAVPGLPIDQRRRLYSDPLLGRTWSPGGTLRTAARPPARLTGDRVFEAVDIGGADVDRVGQDVMDDGGRPLLAARTRHPRTSVQVLHALPDGQPVLEHPGVELSDHRSLHLVHNEPRRHGTIPCRVAVAVRNLGADDVAVARLL
jgi:hypothetical protein